MDLKLLREATRTEHEATEAVVPLMSPSLTREIYAETLQRFHTVVCAWDTFSDQEAPAAFAELVRQRRRCPALVEDLHFLGFAPTGEASPVLVQQMERLVAGAPGSAVSRFLGAMYVVEGSTLGGRYIASHVEDSLGFTPGQGDRYFRGYEEQTIPMWREFQQALVALPDDQADAVISAAQAMFGIFQTVLAGPGTSRMTSQIA